MPKRTVLIIKRSSVIAMSLIGLTLFTEQPYVSMAATIGTTPPTLTATSPGTLSTCVDVAGEQLTHSQTPALSTLDSCYQSLLDKFGTQLLYDITTNPRALLAGLKKMKAAKHLPSVAQVAAQLGTKQNMYLMERQELTTVGKIHVDGDNINPKLIKNYTVGDDQPLFDQLITQLPTIRDQSVDRLFTHAVLAAQLITSPEGPVQLPTYNPPPQVTPPDSAHMGDMSYHGGNVIDGTTNVYLIFWIDTAFPVTPTYVSQIEQFVQDFGQSPYFANLLQYHDSINEHPTSLRLAGTFTDTRPFPPNLVAMRKDPKVTTDPAAQQSMNILAGQTWDQEMTSVIAQQHWNSQDTHNVFAVLPSMNWGCTSHTGGVSTGTSPSMTISYPSYNGQPQCALVPQEPNRDFIADIAISYISSIFVALTTDPHNGGWYTGTNSLGTEAVDKCGSLPIQINPKTDGNVTWNGHTYILQQEYSNLRHGCVLEGP